MKFSASRACACVRAPLPFADRNDFYGFRYRSPRVGDNPSQPLVLLLLLPCRKGVKASDSPRSRSPRQTPSLCRALENGNPTIRGGVLKLAKVPILPLSRPACNSAVQGRSRCRPTAFFFFFVPVFSPFGVNHRRYVHIARSSKTWLILCGCGLFAVENLFLYG